MTDNVMGGLLVGLIVSFFTSSGIVWRKLGQLENAVKKSCPFGNCPVFERSKHEAAPARLEAQESMK